MPSKLERLTSGPADNSQLALDFDGLDELLGFRVRVAHVAMYRDFNASLADLQITQRHTAMLWLIGANPGLSQAEVGAHGTTAGPGQLTELADPDRRTQRPFRQRQVIRVKRLAAHMQMRALVRNGLAYSALDWRHPARPAVS